MRVRHPDNTAIAIGAAFGLVDVVETDIRRTRDGRLVLSHDPTLGGHGVAETEWEALRSVDIGEGQRPMLLEEALRMFPDRRFDLEVKNSPFEAGFESGGEIGRDVLAVARPGDLISSFHWLTIDPLAIQAADRGIATGMLLDIDMPVGDVVEHAVSVGHMMILPSAARLTEWGPESVIEQCHAAAVRVGTWTVNDPGLGIRLAEAGIDAIITDDPGLLVEALARAEQSNRRDE
jgi:glycerophosphoryl diester phosphodiesterase